MRSECQGIVEKDSQLFGNEGASNLWCIDSAIGAEGKDNWEGGIRMEACEDGCI